MIRVTIEIVPEGDGSRARTIADASIALFSPYGRNRIGYKVAVVEEANDQDALPAWHAVETISHDPKQGAVALVAKALTLARRRPGTGS